MAKHSKNLQKVQDMLDDKFERKIQSGYVVVEETHKVGDRWFDSDGKEWEQTDRYFASIKKTPNVGFGDNCLDCKSLIVNPWDKDFFKWNGRCYYCQINFEAKLKTSGKFDEWKEAQDKRIKEGYIERFEKENEELVKEIANLENPFDTKLVNAMSNANVTMEINKNKM